MDAKELIRLVKEMRTWQKHYAKSVRLNEDILVKSDLLYKAREYEALVDQWLKRNA